MPKVEFVVVYRECRDECVPSESVEKVEVGEIDVGK